MWFVYVPIVICPVAFLMIHAEHNQIATAAARLRERLDALRGEPINRRVQSDILSLIQVDLNLDSATLIARKISTAMIYHEALGLLAMHPQNIPLQDFALKVGRWHYSRSRADRRPTPPDERAIQYDMFVYRLNRAA